MDNILNQLSPMKTGAELLSEMTVLPSYDPNIRAQPSTVRLMALSDLYNIYIPSSMSVEIYSKLYLALLRSLQKKEGITAQIQRNENHKRIIQRESNSILGGADSFTVIGSSGIGKSTAINRAIDLITAQGLIENTLTKIIPCLVVQTPHDCSVKGLLLEILRKVDAFLDSDYYPKALKNRVTTDMYHERDIPIITIISDDAKKTYRTESPYGIGYTNYYNCVLASKISVMKLTAGNPTRKIDFLEVS